MIDPRFVAERVATWTGLKKMMSRPDGVFYGQFRSAVKIAKALNAQGHETAHSKYGGTAAYGLALAEIIAKHKAKGKK